MKKIVFLVLTISLVACKQGAETNTEKDSAVDNAVNTTTNDLVDSTQTVPTKIATDDTAIQNNSVMYNTTSAVTNNLPNTTSVNRTAAPLVVAKGMNPAHGQPGHRCEIPVGSPLNAAPAKPASPLKTTTITSDQKPGSFTANGATITTTNSNATATQPGMNPPHGQEGHRCDLAVGAPLNSAPTPAAVPTVPTEIKE